MCLICNVTNTEDGVQFLDHFAAASRSMRAATYSMYACATTAKTAEARHRYGVIHRRMVRLVREWNRLDHDREQRPVTEGDPHE